MTVPGDISKQIDAESAKPRIDHKVLDWHFAIAAKKLSELAFGHFNHHELAVKVRMLLRTDILHEAVLNGARDRIVWLAARYDEVVAQCAEHQRELHEARMEIVRLNNLLRPTATPIGEPPGPEIAV